MLRQAIEKVPENYWFKEKNDWNFAKNVHHILETAEYYLGDSPEGFNWGKLLQTEKENKLSPEDVYPSKKTLLGYLEKMEKRTVVVLQTITDKELSLADGFQKYLPSIFEKLIYLLRHNGHHLGELTRMLREWDCERVKWK
ncbi:MAG: hypothetical protein GF308_08090 [Candidatus Heimdallarchaeota archaeon]|nr:hypothetical protein [Candidatus Heimdallarchaeota archaeon]